MLNTSTQKTFCGVPAHIVRTLLFTLVFVSVFFLLSSFVADARTDEALGEDVVEKGPEGIGEMLLGGLASIVYYLALNIGGVFIGIGGLCLDLSIQMLVIDFGSLFNSTFGEGVVEVWQIIRDLFNIIFIFAFIYIGIRTILNSEDSGTRRAIGNLIVAALFINFSLVIAQTIIDFSNIAATQMYNHIITGGVGANGIDGTFSNDFAKSGQNSISGAFVNVANMSNVFGDSNLLEMGLSASKILVYSLLLMIFFVLAGFIFLFAAIHIIYRFVALSIYMILSPVLFLGLILPNFQGYTKKWLHGLLKQSFYAPAFLFLIYVSLYSMQNLKAVMIRGTGSFGEVVRGGAMDINEFSIFLFFAVTIGFIYASVKVGDMMGIAGANSTLGALNKARMMGQKALGGATFGALGGAGRTIIGKRAHDYAESDGAKEAASKRGLSGAVARIALKGSRVVGDASFDIRRTGIAGKVLGEGKKGGYKTRTEEIEKKEKAFAKSLDEVDDDDTQVRAFIMEKEDLEEHLRDLKVQKDAAETKEEKTTLGIQINKAEKDIKETDEKIKREKSRRQIGSDFHAGLAKETKVKYDNTVKEKNRLKKAFKEAKKAKDEEKKKEIADQMIALLKEQKELGLRAKEANGTLGYAGVLEEKGFWGSLVLGRVVSQNHEAGKAIRKQHEKAVKKSKEDAQADTLRETVEKAASKKD